MLQYLIPLLVWRNSGCESEKRNCDVKVDFKFTGLCCHFDFTCMCVEAVGSTTIKKKNRSLESFGKCCHEHSFIKLCACVCDECLTVHCKWQNIISMFY